MFYLIIKFLRILSLFILNIIFFASAYANNDIFTVEGISIDQTARTASEARTEGLEKGQFEALNKLFKSIVPSDYYSSLPKLTIGDAIDHVKDFSVSNERSSRRRYLANMTVRFRPEIVRSTLRFSNIPFAETYSEPLAIIPFYQPSIVASPFLWESPNPWREAWFSLPDSSGLVPRILPFFDLEDMSSLKIDDILAYNTQKINDWIARYNADRAVIVSASIVDGINSKSVVVSLIFTIDGTEKNFEINSNKDEPWESMLAKASEESWLIIEDKWKNQNLLQFNISGQVNVIFEIQKLEDWINFRSKLENIPQIDDFNLLAISRDRAQLDISFLGDERQLISSMEKRGLRLFSQDGIWIVENFGG